MCAIGRAKSQISATVVDVVIAVAFAVAGFAVAWNLHHSSTLRYHSAHHHSLAGYFILTYGAAGIPFGWRLIRGGSGRIISPLTLYPWTPAVQHIVDRNGRMSEVLKVLAADFKDSINDQDIAVAGGRLRVSLEGQNESVRRSVRRLCANSSL